MPNPSRWGQAERAINISAPLWLYEYVRTMTKERNYGTISNAGLELLVIQAKHDGYPIPEEFQYEPIHRVRKAR